MGKLLKTYRPGRHSTPNVENEYSIGGLLMSTKVRGVTRTSNDYDSFGRLKTTTIASYGTYVAKTMMYLS